MPELMLQHLLGLHTTHCDLASTMTHLEHLKEKFADLRDWLLFKFARKVNINLYIIFEVSHYWYFHINVNTS